MSKKARGFGSDFYDIFRDNQLESESYTEKLRISDIEPRKDQPRKVFDKEALDALEKLIDSGIGEQI